MIRELAQIVFRQVCMSRGRLLDEPRRPPVPSPINLQTPGASAASAQTKAAGLQSVQGEEITGPKAQALALVVLFTQLALRRVQARRAPGGNP